MLERKAFIFNIQKYNTHDGDGVRTLVFFKGCPLRCRWCSNPESQRRRPQIMVQRRLCTDCGTCVSVCPARVHVMTPQGHALDVEKECIGCRKCEEQCPSSALSMVGKPMAISDIVDTVEEDRPFYEMSGGGVTLSGGEALMQPEAAVSLLAACRQRGINTAVETSGYAKPETVLEAARHIDLFLFDLKHMDPERHMELTGVHNALIHQNAKLLLDSKHNVRIRLPLLKNINDDASELEAIADFLSPYRGYSNFKGIDILPYHKLGVGKYAQLGLEYQLEDTHSLSEDDIRRISDFFAKRHFQVSVLRH